MSEDGLNIDPEATAHFGGLAAQWWDPRGPFRTLHDFNPFRIEFLTGIRSLRGARVLDVGCGGGILCEGLAARGARVTGLDSSAELLAVAREHATTKGRTIEYVQTTIEEWADQNEPTFDLITCMELLEHVPDPASVIEACTRLLKPDGDLVLSSINRTARAYLFAIVGAEYLLRLVPRGTHQYARFVRPSELVHPLRACGLRPNRIAGFSYNPLTSQFRFTGRTDVNYFLHARRDP